MKRLEVGQSWDKGTIEYDKSIGRKDGIYPDTILWGVYVNGCMNPSLLTFMQEVAKIVNQFVPDDREEEE